MKSSALLIGIDASFSSQQLIELEIIDCQGWEPIEKSSMEMRGDRGKKDISKMSPWLRRVWSEYCRRVQQGETAGHDWPDELRLLFIKNNDDIRFRLGNISRSLVDDEMVLVGAPSPFPISSQRWNFPKSRK